MSSRLQAAFLGPHRLQDDDRTPEAPIKPALGLREWLLDTLQAQDLGKELEQLSAQGRRGALMGGRQE